MLSRLTIAATMLFALIATVANAAPPAPQPLFISRVASSTDSSSPKPQKATVSVKTKAKPVSHTKPAEVPATGTPAESANALVERATDSVKDQLKKIDSVLDAKPEKIRTSSWTSVAEGAEQIYHTADALLETRVAINAAITALAKDAGTTRKSLADLEQRFGDLAQEAEDDLAGVDGSTLPAELQNAVGREVAAYKTGADVARKASERFSEIIYQQRDKVALINRSGKTLERIKKAALAYQDLAAVGTSLADAQESLNNFGSQLNEVLQCLMALVPRCRKRWMK